MQLDMVFHSVCSPEPNRCASHYLQAGVATLFMCSAAVSSSACLDWAQFGKMMQVSVLLAQEEDAAIGQASPSVTDDGFDCIDDSVTDGVSPRATPSTSHLDLQSPADTHIQVAEIQRQLDTVALPATDACTSDAVTERLLPKAVTGQEPDTQQRFECDNDGDRSAEQTETQRKEVAASQQQSEAAAVAQQQMEAKAKAAAKEQQQMEATAKAAAVAQQQKEATVKAAAKEERQTEASAAQEQRTAAPWVRLQTVSTETAAKAQQHREAAGAARQRREDALVEAIRSPIKLGFDNGRPVAALLIFRCCTQWGAFEGAYTSLFDRIMRALRYRWEPDDALEHRYEDGGQGPHNATLCYWLTNTVTLLRMLQNLQPTTISGGCHSTGAPAGTAGVPTTPYSSVASPYCSVGLLRCCACPPSAHLWQPSRNEAL